MTAKTIRGPRQYLRFPEEFGVTDPPDPAPLKATETYKADAALIQHEVARMVTEQMARLNITYDDLAAQVGTSVEQLRRVLRGESPMSIERLHHLAAITGLTVKTTVTRDE